jgi:hypothetical protein
MVHHDLWSNFGIRTFVNFLLLKMLLKMVKLPFYLAFNFQFKFLWEFQSAPLRKAVEHEVLNNFCFGVKF